MYTFKFQNNVQMIIEQHLKYNSLKIVITGFKWLFKIQLKYSQYFFGQCLAI